MALIDKITAIANQIRSYGGLYRTMTLEDMAQYVSQVYARGNTVGLKNGLAAGKEEAKAEFWEVVPVSAQKYLFAGPAWNVHTFFPRKNLIFSGNATDHMFSLHGISSDAYDLADRLTQCNVTLDVSGVTRANYMFYTTNFTKLPFLDLSGCSKLQQTFSGNKSLQTIVGLQVGEDTGFEKTFDGCDVLTDIRIAGVVGQNGLDMSACPLNKESLLSILNALKEGVSGLTVTLGNDNLAKLTQAEKAIATNKGWVLQ